jgi:hypothetical protein
MFNWIQTTIINAWRTYRLSNSNGAYAWSDSTSYVALSSVSSGTLRHSAPAAITGKLQFINTFNTTGLSGRKGLYVLVMRVSKHHATFKYHRMIPRSSFCVLNLRPLHLFSLPAGNCYQNTRTTSAGVTTVSFTAVSCSAATTTAPVICKKGDHCHPSWRVLGT